MALVVAMIAKVTPTATLLFFIFKVISNPYARDLLIC